MGKTRAFGIALMVFRFILLIWVFGIIVATLLKRKTMREVLSVHTIKDIFYLTLIFTMQILTISYQFKSLNYG